MEFEVHRNLSKQARQPLEQNPSRRRKRRVELSCCRAGTYRLVAPAYRLVAPALTPSVFWSPGSSRHLPGSSRRPKNCAEDLKLFEKLSWCLGAAAICFFGFHKWFIIPPFHSYDMFKMSNGHFEYIYLPLFKWCKTVFVSSCLLNNDNLPDLLSLFTEWHTCFSQERYLKKFRLFPSLGAFRWQCKRKSGHLKTVKGTLPCHCFAGLYIRA